MTNLIRWLMYTAFISAISAATALIPGFEDWRMSVLVPLFCAVVFAVYAVVTVLYRSLNVRDCPDAAKELRQQIFEARSDLVKFGLSFEEEEY